MPRRALGAAGKGAGRSQKGVRLQITEIERRYADDQAIYVRSCHIHALRRAIKALARLVGQVNGSGSAKRSRIGGRKRKGKLRP